MKGAHFVFGMKPKDYETTNQKTYLGIAGEKI